MFSFPVWDTGWAEAFASMIFMIAVGRSAGNETRTTLICLVGATLTQSWVGVIVGALLSLVLWALDIFRRM